MQNPGQGNMKRFYSYLNSAAGIIQSYNGQMPFSHFIKNYFSRYKKFGSKDRKQITSLCYGYFRLGRSFPGFSTEQKIVKGVQWCHQELEREWEPVISEYAISATDPENIFPFKKYLSKNIDATAFERSHLVQPCLFLRIRPGLEHKVKDRLANAGIAFKAEENSVCLPNGSKIEPVIALNKEAVIQDLSSQRTGELMKIVKAKMYGRESPVTVWDCCAASGGKSILAKDILQNIQLTVSDIRPSILANLRKRLGEAGIHDYNAFVADVTVANPKREFDLIIADVPCTGSGTWARTPEQLCYFDEKQIEKYGQLQSAILQRVASYLKPGGFLLYITCSVFEGENEQQVQWMQSKHRLQLIEQKIIAGYTHNADTMFCALLCKA